MKNDSSERAIVKIRISIVCMVNFKFQVCSLVGAFALLPTS